MPPTPAQIAKVDTYRQRWETFYPWATDARASVDTRLDGCGTGTTECVGTTSPQCGLEPDGDVGDGDLTCTPGATRCESESLIVACNSTGTAWKFQAECVGGQVCSNAQCVDAADDDDDDATDDDDDDATDDDDDDDVVSPDGDETDGDDTTGGEELDGDDALWRGDSDNTGNEETESSSSGGCSQSLPSLSLMLAGLLALMTLRVRRWRRTNE